MKNAKFKMSNAELAGLQWCFIGKRCHCNAVRSFTEQALSASEWVQDDGVFVLHYISSDFLILNS